MLSNYFEQLLYSSRRASGLDDSNLKPAIRFISSLVLLQIVVVPVNVVIP